LKSQAKTQENATTFFNTNVNDQIFI